jgi:hypothetical protein
MGDQVYQKIVKSTHGLKDGGVSHTNTTMRDSFNL